MEDIVRELHKNNVKFFQLGTQAFIEIRDPSNCEDLTEYPSILGGRVNPSSKIFGGILNRRALRSDQETISEYEFHL